MFPRNRKRRGETEADEDNMASRLQLDLGMYVAYVSISLVFRPLTFVLVFLVNQPEADRKAMQLITFEEFHSMIGYD